MGPQRTLCVVMSCLPVPGDGSTLMSAAGPACCCFAFACRRRRSLARSDSNVSAPVPNRFRSREFGWSLCGRARGGSWWEIIVAENLLPKPGVANRSGGGKHRHMRWWSSRIKTFKSIGSLNNNNCPTQSNNYSDTDVD